MLCTLQTKADVGWTVMIELKRDDIWMMLGDLTILRVCYWDDLACLTDVAD